MNMVMNMNMVTIISFWYSIADMKQAEKLISCKMKGGWMKNDDGRMKNDEGKGQMMKDDDFKLLSGFGNGQTD